MTTIYRVLLALAALTFAAVIGLCCWLFFYTGDLPKTDQLSEFAPKADGHLATDACLDGPSFVISFDRIGKPLQDALTSAEPTNTYADQIARTLMCDQHERSAEYQLSVFRLGWHIRRRFSDRELLTIYANRAYFGPATIGVDNASRQFFQKEPSALSVEEAALLAGVLRGPSVYSPFKNSDLALHRRNQILETMAAQGKLSGAELERAVATPIGTRVSPDSITKAMFPGAPQKAQSVDCFRGFNHKTSVDKVAQKCGSPDELLGSGVYIFVWHLADGSTVTLNTPYLSRIDYFQYRYATGKSGSLLDSKE